MAPVNEVGTVKNVVLYRTPGRWRYAIRTSNGLTCGHLLETAPAAPESDAQAALLSLIEHGTGRKIEASWHATQPDWWAADISDVPQVSRPF